MAINGPRSFNGVERLDGVPTVTPTDRQPPHVAVGQGESRFTPTDLPRLLAGLAQEPQVRSGLLADVAGRLASGELFTSQAARQAAQGLRDAGALDG